MRPFLQHRFRSQDNLWLVLMLLVAIVIVPTACLFWFLNQAVQNERLAVRQRLMAVYRSQLSVVQEKLEAYWQQQSDELDALAKRLPAPAIFAQLVLGGKADAVICFHADGTVSYPSLPAAPPQSPVDGVFAEAHRLERLEGDASQAADEFGRIAKESSETNVIVRALQGQARCLAK